ncbi:MAG: hypothetical protein KatS3mg131_1307 [Candidatus Tectimicrobiota bacterium]|nr:MAG: hypothetical protein KatS3mg131_1307 [Candidatus Tectomicrobia bacterium]
MAPATREHDALAALWQACDALQALQEAHRQRLQREKQPDLARLAFERARAFAEFKNRLLSTVRRLQQERRLPALRETLRQRLLALLAAEAALREQLDGYRQTLEAQLACVRQGQRALRGYGSACQSSPRHHVNRAV